MDETLKSIRRLHLFVIAACAVMVLLARGPHRAGQYRAAAREADILFAVVGNSDKARELILTKGSELVRAGKLELDTTPLVQTMVAEARRLTSHVGKLTFKGLADTSRNSSGGVATDDMAAPRM